MNQFVGSEVSLSVDGTDVTLVQESAFPWEGEVTLRVDAPSSVEFPLHVRVPNWCEAASTSIDGEEFAVDADGSYLVVDRKWEGGDELTVSFEMEPERLVAHPAVRDDAGKTVLRRGPLVYCLEGVDHERPLHHYAIPETARLDAEYDSDLLGGVVTLSGPARVPAMDGWEADLYRPASDASTAESTVTAVPYYAWANREAGEMRVWLRSAWRD